MTLIAWTELTPNYSAIISDTLISTMPSYASQRPFLPSDTQKSKMYQSTELGHFYDVLVPKCYVLHPNLAVAFSGSKFNADSVMARMSKQLCPDEPIPFSYIEEVCGELNQLNKDAYIFVYLDPENRDVKIFSHGSCTEGRNSSGMSYIAAGTGDSIFEEDHSTIFDEELIDKNADSELWLAEMRGLSIIHNFTSSEFIGERNLIYSIGGIFDCLFVDHKNFRFFSTTNYWQNFQTVHPISPSLRNFYPQSPFIHHSICPKTKSLTLDLYQSTRETQRGFLCKKKRFSAKRNLADYRLVKLSKAERWVNTFHVVFGQKVIGSFGYIDQKGTGEKPWLKQRRTRNGFEFVYRGYRMERGIPGILINDKRFLELLENFPDFHESLYEENARHTTRRFVKQDQKRA